MYAFEYDYNHKVMRYFVFKRTVLLYVEDLNVSQGTDALKKLVDANINAYADVGEYISDGNGKTRAEVFLNILDKEKGVLNKEIIGYLEPEHGPLFELSSEGYRIGVIDDYAFREDDLYIVLAVTVDLAKLDSTTAQNYRFYDLPNGYWNSEKDQVLITWKEFYNGVQRQPLKD